MSGGAVQENWALDVELDGELRRWVLRTDARAAVRESLTRAQEFAVLKVAHARGRAARPSRYICARILPSRAGCSSSCSGCLASPRATGSPAIRQLVPEPARLARELAANLARLHRIRPPQPGSAS